MECTPEQIEQKRKQAQAKLQARKLQKSFPSNGLNKVINNGPNLSSPNKVNYNQIWAQNSTTNNVAIPNMSHSINQFNASNNFNSPANSNNESSRTSLSNSVNTSNSFISKVLQNSPANKLHNKTPYTKPVPPQQFFGQTSVTGTICMISDTKFEVNLSGYYAKAIEIFKSIPSRSYDTKTKLWNFELKDYELLLNRLNVLNPELVVGKIPPFVFEAIKQPKLNEDIIDLTQIESELLNTLMPFQKTGVCFGINNNGRLLIADDMGLGKTFQALAIADYYKADWPLLIVTTSSMRNTWEETIHKYLPSVPLMAIQYMVTGKDYINDSKVLITSHDMMSRNVEKLLDRHFGVVILDESHVLKNFKTKCTKAAETLAKRAKRIILLSGTPALSRPNELYSQLALIDDKFFGDFYKYSKRYCDAKSTNFGWDSSGKSNLAELEVILSRKFMIRRTKNDVLNTLPSKTREVIKLDVSLMHLSKDERTIFTSLVNDYNVTKAQERHSVLLSLFSETAKIKIPSVCNYINQLLKENIKFLVFAHHQKMLNAVCKILNNNKMSFVRIDGSTTPDRRKFYVDKFQLNENCICAVLSITAANAGITLTAAQVVLFAELHWNPSILSQAESRAHRIGQQNDVIVRYLLAEGTADDYIWPMLLEKQDVLSEVGLSKESFKNTTVSKQTVPVNQNGVEQKLISDWFKKESETVDDTLQNFMQDDDDIFANINI